MTLNGFILAAALVASPVAGYAQPAPAPDTAAGAPASTGASTAPSTPAAATLADLTPGAPVYDPSGNKIGTIESATAAGAVVSTGAARAQIPVTAFGKSTQGLALATTKTQLEAAVAKASARP